MFYVIEFFMCKCKLERYFYYLIMLVWIFDIDRNEINFKWNLFSLFLKLRNFMDV